MNKDIELEKSVRDEIALDPMLSSVSSSIDVKVENGVVTLSGSVDTYWQKHAVETAVQRVAGVSFMAVDINVKQRANAKDDDAAIAQAIKSAFRHLSILDYEILDVKVDEGIVTLEGTLRWNYQRQAAETYVRNITGVLGVNNNIKLSDEPCDANAIMEKINAAFHRNAILDAASIRVEVEGTRAVLSGNVRSWIEKKDAEKVVWSSPGVKTVENRLVIVNPYVS